jgi:hypothetical protein
MTGDRDDRAASRFSDPARQLLVDDYPPVHRGVHVRQTSHSPSNVCDTRILFE